MLFVQYNPGFPNARYFTPAQYGEVEAVSAPGTYKGRPFERVTQISQKKQEAYGFSSVLAEEEDAILTRLATV